MHDSNINSSKYGVQNNRNVTHQIILNIDNMSGSISSPKNETQGHSGGHARADSSKQYRDSETLGQHTKRGKSKKEPPLSIGINLYATSSKGKIYTQHFYRSKNHDFGVEVRIHNSTSCVYSFNIAGCIYDSNGVEIYRWTRTTKKVSPSDSPVENDFWVDRDKFLAMRDGEYKMQLWINDIKVVRTLFWVSK